MLVELDGTQAYRQVSDLGSGGGREGGGGWRGFGIVMNAQEERGWALGGGRQSQEEKGKGALGGLRFV
jgi:hypothetical protein